jgi:PAS domain S-box-containing protein
MAESEPSAGHILLLVGRAPDRQVLAAMLTEAGYCVATSSPGPSSLATIREAAPDLVVLGVGAPGEDGYEICSRVQADERLWQVPILLAGVPSDPRDRERAFGAGAVDTLARPFQREEVLSRVGTHLALKALRQRLAEAEARLEQARTERQALEADWEAAQAALQDAEERGRDLVENLSEVIFTAGLDGLLTYVSPGVEPFLGYAPPELVGRHVRDVVHADDHAPLAMALGQVLSGQRVTNEYRLLTKAGEVRWVQTSSQPTWEEGEVTGAQGVLVDITERRQAEERIWQQNEFLHRVLESLTHPFYVVDAQDYTIHMANSAAQMEGLTGRATCYALTHGRDAPCETDDHPCPLEQIKRTKGPVMVEHLHTAPDGSLRNVEVHGYPLLDADGKVTRVIEYALDVTERKHMEAQLRWELRVDAALSELYRPLTSPTSTIEEIAGVILHGARSLTGSEHGYVSSFDPVSGDMVAHTLTEMLGNACQIAEGESCIIFPRGSDGRYPGLWGASLNAQEALYVNDVASHPASSGTPEGHIPLERFLSVPVVLGDELVGQIALANPQRDYADRDLDAARRLAEFYALAIQRKRVQDALRRERDVVSAILDTAGALVVVLDTEGRIVRFNRACERTTGYAFDEVEGIPFWELFLVPEEMAPVQAVFHELRAGQFPNQYENHWLTKDGERRLIAWSNTALLDERGAVEYVVATGIDITERTQAEEALHDQIKRAATADERSRLARDLHDSVTQALFSATLVAEVLPQVWRRDPEEALEGVEELRHLTRGALAEMRTMLLELRPTALVETRLDDLLRQLTEAVTSRVQLSTAQHIDTVPDLPAEVHVTFYRVAQEALHNVVKHAEAQQVTVYLGTSPVYDPQAEDPWTGQVVLRVRDDGRGFDVQAVGPDRLGLGIMRERAEAVGATLTLESYLGSGTEVALVWEQGVASALA